MEYKKIILRGLFLIIVFFISSTENNIFAASYPLDIINIDEVGANNRIKIAYPGILYEVPVVVEGGLYPFNFELLESPSGMTIDNNGIIRWNDPIISGSPYNITVRVVDDENSNDIESFTLTVDPSLFVFVDDSWTGNENGTIFEPYSSIDALWSIDLIGKAMILREGTYTIPHVLPSVRNDIARIPINEGNPEIWLAYPGENVIIDQEHSVTASPYYGYAILLGDNNDSAFFSGLTFKDVTTYGLVVIGPDYLGIYDCKWGDNYYSGIGSNASLINFMNANLAEKGWVHSSIFGLSGSESSESTLFALETYDTSHWVIYNNIFQDIARGINLKDDSNYTTVRKNIFNNLRTDMALYSQGYQGGCSETDVSFNYINGGYGVYFGGVLVGRNFWYRNTLVEDLENGLGFGYWRGLDTAVNGPFLLYNNVIVSDHPDSGDVNTSGYYRNGAYFRYSAGVFDTQFSYINNLIGASVDNIVDANGELTSEYISFLGTHGWQFGSEDLIRPQSPIGLIVQ